MSEPRPGSTPPSGSSRSLVTVLGIVVVVLLVVIVAVIGYLVFGRSTDSGFPIGQSSSNSQVSTTPNQSTSTSTSTPTPTTPSRTPVPRTTDSPTTDDTGPTVAGAPSGSTPCPVRYGRTGLYRASSVGSSVTTCGFAEEVREAYAESGRPGQLPRTVSAVSPENGVRYTMSCAAQRSIVTCTGGDDAVVYLYR